MSLTTDGMLCANTKYFKKLELFEFDMRKIDRENTINHKECSFFEELKNEIKITTLKCENNTAYYTIISKTKEIIICLELGLYGAALSLALTIPDTCGAIAYPKNKKPNVKYRYIKWLNDYVFTKNNEDSEVLLKNGFDGEVCYMLRNKFLHQNTSCNYMFDFTLSNEYSIVRAKKKEMQIGIPFLCDAIVDGVCNFIKNDYPSPLDYSTYGFKVKLTSVNMKAKNDNKGK